MDQTTGLLSFEILIGKQIEWFLCKHCLSKIEYVGVRLPHPVETLVHHIPVFGSHLHQQSANIQNEEGELMELHVPRKCSTTNKLIMAKDHTFLQINIGHLDENSLYTGQYTNVALCGFIRAQGDADRAVDRLWQNKKVEARQQ